MAARRRAAWLVADQALSSVSNVALAIFVARTASVTDFGAFAVSSMIYMVVLELARPLAFDALLVRFSGAPSAEGRHAFAGAGGVALALGVVAGVPVAAIGLAVGGATGPMLLALGVALPGLLLQDACRYALMAAGRAVALTLNDALWLGLQIGSFVLLVVTDVGEPAWLVAAWGAAAAIAALAGLVQLVAVPRIAAARTWIRDQRDLSPNFVVEYLIDMGSLQLTMLAVGIVAGLDALAALNGARVLLGPLNVLFISGMSITVTEGARLRAAGDRRVVWLVRGAGAALSAIALAWTLALLVLPDDVGRAVLGDSFGAAETVLLGFGVYTAARGLIQASRAGFRIAQLARKSAVTMARVAPLAMAGGVGGALIGGAEGGAWGLAIGNVVGAVIWALRFEGVSAVARAAQPTE